MAKFCEVCKRSYPDDQPSCPRCAAVVEDSGIDLGVVEEEADALLEEEPSSISGVSAVDWAELVDEPATATAPAAGAPPAEDSAIDLGQAPQHPVSGAQASDVA